MWFSGLQSSVWDLSGGGVGTVFLGRGTCGSVVGTLAGIKRKKGRKKVVWGGEMGYNGWSFAGPPSEEVGRIQRE